MRKYAVDKKHKRILYFDEADSFQHHGVLGQRWGVITKNTGVNYIPKGYRKTPITKENLKDYASQASQLRHVRVNKNTNGYLLQKNGKLAGMVNTERKPDGHVWIQGLELFGDAKGKGYSRHMLDIATKDLGATHLSVNKNNKVAKHVYDKYGFETYDEDGSMYYMSLQKRSGETSTLSKSVYDRAKKKEPAITNDVTSTAASIGAKMYGLEHRLKTQESINRKIKTDSVEKGISPKEASKIKDAVRYTVMSNDNKFVNNYFIFKNKLSEKGYTEVKCKNYFELYREGKVKHKSVQSIFKDKDGYLFEIQFQTPASQKAKDLKVPIYEERRQFGLSVERQAELEQKMVDLAERVPYPIGINRIKSY